MFRTTPRRRVAVAACALALALAAPAHPFHAHAQTQSEGSVRIPLSDWLAMTRGAAPGESSAASLGLGEARVEIEDREGRSVAVATVTVPVRARSADSEVLLLPAGVALASATSDGQAISLTRGPGGLYYHAETAGTHRVELRYELDVTRAERGASVALPLPPAPSLRLHAVLPPEASDAAVVPSVGARDSRVGASPALDATIPGGAAAHLAWRTSAISESARPSRAIYRGELGEDSVHFDVELGIELDREGAISVPLFPIDVALGSVTVDAAEAPLRAEEGFVAVVVRGRGRHTIRASIEIPLQREEGLPSARVRVPEVPVSRFEMLLPEGKDVRVSPVAAVRRERGRSGMVAVFHVPLTSAVELEWPEATPEERGEEPEVRASAELVHVLQADEGILHGRVRGVWEIARGSASRFEMEVPPGVDVDAVGSDVGSVSDWRLSEERSGPRTLTVFLDRAVSGTITLSIDFEVLRSSAAAGPFSVPLLSARGVRHQRGMLALLATRELVLEPDAADDLVRVGENQLPAEVRAEIEDTIAHVFRWTDAPPAMRAHVSERPHEAARFDVRVDTLVSLGDVTTTASASVDVRVKSGSLAELDIALPQGSSLLDVSAPSLREHRVREEAGHPVVHLSFTQEMEGELRVDLRWERIAAAGETAVSAPLAHVAGADVEQGRIAIEATAAVEVEARDASGLSPVDLADLPEELVLRSVSPILLAFRYAHAAPAPSLELGVARHEEVALRDATIDEASFRTLVTADGLAVTTATWMVRNQRQQFLRITLPEGAEIWSAQVGGRAETPALASERSESGGPVVLVGVLRSLEAFPVEITYATPVSSVAMLGRVGLELPRPDVVATRATWEVYLPAGPRWGEPSSDVELRSSGEVFAGGAGLDFVSSQEGLAIEVPREGERFVFEGLYVGREGQRVRASFPYASRGGVLVGWGLGLFGAFLAWLGLLGLIMARAGIVFVPEGGPFELATYRMASAARTVAVSRAGAASLAAALLTGLAIVGFAIVWLGASPLPPLTGSALVAMGLLIAMRKPIVARLTAMRGRMSPAAPSGAAAAASPAAVAPAADAPAQANASPSEPTDPER